MDAVRKRVASACTDERSLIVQVAKGINAAQIPCVLWSESALALYGVLILIVSVDFVVPDDCLEKAAAALASLPPSSTDEHRLERCLDPATCRRMPSPLHQQAAVHLHTTLVSDGSRSRTVGLFPQSEALWTLPPLGSMADALLSPETQPLPEYFILATDQKALPPPSQEARGRGYFVRDAQQPYHPVVLPTTIVMLEACLRMHARAFEQGESRIGQLAGLKAHVEDAGYLDASQLPECMRSIYARMWDNDMHNVVPCTMELVKALRMDDIANGREVPAAPVQKPPPPSRKGWFCC